MADLSSCFTSSKKEKQKKTFPDSSTTSDIDTDAILSDSDYGKLYANVELRSEVLASDKAHLRHQARKKLKAKGVRRETTKKKALADESEEVLRECIRRLSVELNRRNSAAKTDDEGPVLPQEIPAQVNTSEVRKIESGVILTPEQFTIWIEMQRNILMSQSRPQPPTSTLPHHTRKTELKCEVNKNCIICKKEHMLWQCPQFKLLSGAEKLKFIFTNKCCLHCLNPGHRYKSCTFFPERVCGLDGCEDKHHRQLHNFPDSRGRTLMSAEEYIRIENVLMANQTCHSVEHDEYIAIRTTTALLSHNGKERRVVIAMDPCSNSTNIDEDFAKEMGLHIEEKGLVRNINFLESSATVTSDLVSFVLSPLNREKSFKIKAFTVKNLTTGTPVVDWRKVSESYVHLKEANIPEAHESDRVHVLLGTDYAHLNASSRSLCGGDMEPVAEFTKLGWAFSGRVKSNQILPGWISQFGRLANRTFFTFIQVTQERKQTKKCTQEGSLLHRVMITSTEETFKSLSSENDVAILDALHYSEKSSETKDVWSNTPEPSALGSPSEGHGSDPEEKSNFCHLIEGDENDGSRNSLLARIDTVGRFAGDSNQNLCTYLNLAPTVETKRTKAKCFRRTNLKELGNLSTWTC
jgi:hypothetical protein